MKTRCFCPNLVARWVGIFVLGLCLAHPAFSQFTLDAFSPADGATDVGTVTTVELTFSEAVDQNAAFDHSDGFFLGLEVFPDPGVPLDIRVSGDGRTVSVDLQLEDDTRYQVMLTGAFSATGQQLDRPYSYVFSTGSALPQATVSGTLSFSGGSPIPSLVGLFTTEGPLFGGDPLALTVVTDASGAYTLDFVEEDDYVLAGFKDLNDDGTVDDLFFDAMGFYDGDADRVVDEISVGAGQQVAGIDLTINPPDLVTASDPLPFAENMARNEAADAAFTGLVSTVTPQGVSFVWVYFFYGPANQDSLAVVRFGDFFTVRPGVSDRNDEVQNETIPFDARIPVTGNWIDSDEALAQAEANGGADFRAANTIIEIVLFLGHFSDDGLCSFSDKRGPGGTGRVGDAAGAWLEKARAASVVSAEGALQDLQWAVFYRTATFPFFVVCIDAEGGGVVTPPAATTAGFNQTAADQEAQAWANDAQLKVVDAITADGLDASGNTTGWFFLYFSPSLDRARLVFMVNGAVDSAGDVNTGLENNLRTLTPLPENWIDTSVATPTAEANSNDFRAQHADALVTGRLARGQLDAEPERAVWKFTYRSEQADDSLMVFIDAETGAVVPTAVEAEPGVPEAFVLEQNYPNPFNPSTHIPFGLAQGGHVTLAVYDVLGRRIATLVDAFLAAGNYRATWHPDGLPSGVYLYELTLGDAVLSRTMLLQK